MSARRLRADARELLRHSGRGTLTDTLLCCCAPLFLTLTVNLLAWALEQAVSGASGGLGAHSLRSFYSFSSAVLYILSLAAGLITVPLALSFKFVMLRRVRQRQTTARDLRTGFRLYFRALVLELLTGLRLALWTCLFLVPGLVAAYRYRFAPYLLCDHPEYLPSRALRESGRLARGHKRTLLRLDLCFLPYYLPLLLGELLMNLTAIFELLEPWMTLPALGYEQALLAFAIGVGLCVVSHLLFAAHLTGATALCYDRLVSADADPTPS